MRMPLPPRGVLSPFAPHVHPYPTRYHGPVYTRPVFGTPYRVAPQAVFMPHDFHAFSGAGSLGSLGGGYSGLGAIPGTKMYWLGAANGRVKYLQEGINKVLSAKGYYLIGVDGIFGKNTCGALGLCLMQFQADIVALVDIEVLKEAIAVCDGKDPTGKTWVWPAQDPHAVQNSTAPVVPVTPAPPVVVAPPVVPVETAPPVTAPPPVWTQDSSGGSQITYTPSGGGGTVLPELEIEGDIAPKKKTTQTGVIVAAAVLAGGVGIYFFMKRKR